MNEKTMTEILIKENLATMIFLFVCDLTVLFRFHSYFLFVGFSRNSSLVKSSGNRFLVSLIVTFPLLLE